MTISSTSQRAAMPREGDVVRTASGRALTLTSVLGRGGQGAVYRTDDPRSAVKLRWSTADVASWRQRIERSALLKSDRSQLNGVHRFVLARELLASPWVGYEMPLLPDAHPVTELLRLPPQQAEAAYIQSGGLKRRLGIAARTARALSSLHAAGFVFGDLSASNVLTTSVPTHSSVRIIDCDNIDVAGCEGVGVIGTPGYWAPELCSGRVRPDAASDDHALAVLIHELVYLVHPLRGDALLDEEPEQAEARVRRGELPWVFAEQDDRNRTRAGLPAELSPPTDSSLFARFAEAFGPGLHDRSRRPTAAALLDAVERLHRLCLTCATCGASQLYRRQRQCGWCGSALPAPLMLVIEPESSATEFAELRAAREFVERARQLPQLKQTLSDNPASPLRGFRYRNCVIEDGLVLSASLLRPLSTQGDDESPLVRVAVEGDRMSLQLEGNCLLLKNGKPIAQGGSVTLRPGDSLVMPGEQGEPSCRLRFHRPRRDVP